MAPIKVQRKIEVDPRTTLSQIEIYNHEIQIIYLNVKRIFPGNKSLKTYYLPLFSDLFISHVASK